MLSGRQRGGSGSRLPGEDAGHAEANGKVRVPTRCLYDVRRRSHTQSMYGRTVDVQSVW